MLRSSAKISDLFFSPGKPPLVEINGKLAPAGSTRALTSEDTRRIAADLMGNNQHATDNLNKLDRAMSPTVCLARIDFESTSSCSVAPVPS